MDEQGSDTAQQTPEEILLAKWSPVFQRFLSANIDIYQYFDSTTNTLIGHPNNTELERHWFARTAEVVHGNQNLAPELQTPLPLLSSFTDANFRGPSGVVALRVMLTEEASLVTLYPITTNGTHETNVDMSLQLNQLSTSLAFDESTSDTRSATISGSQLDGAGSPPRTVLAALPHPGHPSHGPQRRGKKNRKTYTGPVGTKDRPHLPDALTKANALCPEGLDPDKWAKCYASLDSSKGRRANRAQAHQDRRDGTIRREALDRYHAYVKESEDRKKKDTEGK